MMRARDVAAYIVKLQPTVKQTALHKLLYYTQAWSLAWDGVVLFPDKIEAWKQGPVIRDVWEKNQRQWPFDDLGDLNKVQPDAQGVIGAVLDFYGHMPVATLVERTHSEQPWLEARRGLGPCASSTNAVERSAMRIFYADLSVRSTDVPKRPASFIVEAQAVDVAEARNRQIRKWTTTLDWLAIR